MKTEQTWGPIVLKDGRTRFQIWAPSQARVLLELDNRLISMAKTEDGWHRTDEQATAGTAYRFVLGNGHRIADPASRRQSMALDGPSILTDANKYNWQVGRWKGRDWEEAVIYELHIGTFTRDGTFKAAAEKIAYLAEIGFTAIELMPLAHFPGERGWGYDGVLHFAPHNAYGTPDDLKMLVDTAHCHGVMVFLDVVYNHFGPEGNHLGDYAPQFFRDDVSTPWGAAIDFRRPEVRAYFVENALYWLTEFRFDGLRFDAIDQIRDQSDLHILEELAQRVRSEINGRRIHLITENPANSTDLTAERLSGRLYSADWNDDFHHAMHVAVTGEKTGYYEAFDQDPWQLLRKIVTQGYLNPGSGVLTDNPPPSASLLPTAFIHFLQNHDQVGNRAFGDRLHLGINRQLYRALVEMLMLSPQIPMVFMGDDHLSPRPFHFFADYGGEMAKAVRDNRPKEASNFGGIPEGASASDIPDPNDMTTFNKSKLDWNDNETEGGAAWSKFLATLIGVRQRWIVPLLKDVSEHSSSALDAPEGCLFIDWRLGTATLQIRANLSKTNLPRPDAVGSKIYETSRCVGSDIPAFSVEVWACSG
ncbi:malto-oligosyltrehalose trehalohydrolase [Rhizobium sp. S163]|uniref:malto-oligosyltrehalose trehalohydrolase n=1 Tax=Rhizobium sp. S163 TaxID=3055039 RepID=UPI0025A99EBB|nr:malto-oligosyltrehalose trehalohydrolase [Rhizobium sp. S163]MDM9646432.1 malto-oligosyltrehalose trehalohydrolase [Rhizobium sp. S163]